MAEEPHDLLRIRTDYVGAGRYLLSDDESTVIVNTDYGVQAVDRSSHERWQSDLGERCLGVGRRSDGRLIAHSLHAVYEIGDSGEVLHVNPAASEIAYAPLAWQDGLVVITLRHVVAIDADGQTRWTFKFSDALGESVRAVLVVNAWTTEDGVFLGAVDYNTGIGRVIFLGTEGEIGWQSEVAPITDVFPVDDDEFVYTLSQFPLRFETHRAGLDGRKRWSLDYGGTGVMLPDRRIAMLVGNNESPKWDDWELRVLNHGGVRESSAKLKGHFGHAPILGPDDALWFVGFFKPFDPTATRLDYTSLTPLPRFLSFDHQMGHKAQPHQYLVYYFRSTIDDPLPTTVFEDRDSIAFGPPVAGAEHVWFTHNRDVIGFPVG